MTQAYDGRRTDSASRQIAAPPSRVYAALLDPDAIAAWRAPAGMACEILAFDPREGGEFRLLLRYLGTQHEARGKTSEHVDMVRGRFLQLVPDARVVEQVEFESRDPQFAGSMTITTALITTPEGTIVTITCENVPTGIRPEDHAVGMASTLRNLATLLE
jgi:uncharacterized protein YndB with AHSA1/START domain